MSKEVTPATSCASIARTNRPAHERTVRAPSGQNESMDSAGGRTRVRGWPAQVGAFFERTCHIRRARFGGVLDQSPAELRRRTLCEFHNGSSIMEHRALASGRLCVCVCVGWASRDSALACFANTRVYNHDTHTQTHMSNLIITTTTTIALQSPLKHQQPQLEDRSRLTAGDHLANHHGHELARI